MRHPKGTNWGIYAIERRPAGPGSRQGSLSFLRSEAKPMLSSHHLSMDHGEGL